jgi:DNA modification methylase
MRGVGHQKQTAVYRGNWSPYIPRNLILKYSLPGQTVLDGAATTAIEAKLLQRKCVAIDINENAVCRLRKYKENRFSQKTPEVVS